MSRWINGNRRHNHRSVVFFGGSRTITVKWFTQTKDPVTQKVSSSVPHTAEVVGRSQIVKEDTVDGTNILIGDRKVWLSWFDAKEKNVDVESTKQVVIGGLTYNIVEMIDAGPDASEITFLARR